MPLAKELNARTGRQPGVELDTLCRLLDEKLERINARLAAIEDRQHQLRTRGQTE